MINRVVSCSVAAVVLAALIANAQDAEQPAANDPPAVDAPKKAPEELSQSQLQLMRDFERFEKSLYDVAEFSRRTDPERAELLYRARSQSQEQRILTEMQALADGLRPQAGGKLVIGDAPERQEQLLTRLEELLKVLQSADERDRLQREIDRVNDLLKDTTRLIGKQRDVRSDTSRSSDPSQLSDQEKKVAEDAEKLAEKIDRQDKERNPDPAADESKPDEKGKPGDDGQKSEDSKNSSGDKSKKPDDDGKGERPKPEDDNKKPGEESKDPPKPGDQPEEDKPSEKAGEKNSEKPPRSQPPKSSKPSDSPQSKPKPGESPPPDQQPPQDGQLADPQQDQPPPRQPQELGSPQQPPARQSPPPQGDRPRKPEQTPGREQLEEARNQMKRAIEELLKKQKAPSLAAQQKALANLEQMKARLEEILRQLREQEKELMLATLESRLQKIRKAQVQINAETVRLEKIPAAERGDRHLNRSVALSRDQRDVVLDTEKALELMKTEGSSVAFPEALEQMRDNMVTVSGRLNRGDTAETTQVIEELIVETLDEMILAISQEMQRQKERQQQPQQQQQQGGEQEQRLVQEIAELKMIRSLQNQINRLTRQIGRQLDGEQAEDPDHRKLTDDLARRQKRLQEATYDLSVGKNK